jgi:hypothetical protein
MRGWPLAVVGLLLLAGCSSAPKAVQSTDSIAPGTGTISGIVVDTGIRPLAKVHVVLDLPAGGNRTADTDARGAYRFQALAPGTYFLVFTHLLYHTLQSSVEVKEGQASTPRAMLEPVFTAKPYHEQIKVKGYLLCGYGSLATNSICVLDYTQLVCGGGCAPEYHEQLQHLQGDKRSFDLTVGARWETLVMELAFSPPAAGNAKYMVMSLSYRARTASESFGSVTGPSPLALRFETGVKHPTETGSKRTMINASGEDDLYLFLNEAADPSSPVVVAYQQDLQLFETTFYNAKPPPGWGFAKGDDFPF